MVCTYQDPHVQACAGWEPARPSIPQLLHLKLHGNSTTDVASARCLGTTILRRELSELESALQQQSPRHKDLRATMIEIISLAAAATGLTMFVDDASGLVGKACNRYWFKPVNSVAGAVSIGWIITPLTHTVARQASRQHAP